jgi:hypothetical protein
VKGWEFNVDGGCGLLTLNRVHWGAQCPPKTPCLCAGLGSSMQMYGVFFLLNAGIGAYGGQ